MSLIGFGKSPSGADAIEVAGHEIPVSMLAIVASVLGVLLLLRARASGSNVIATGVSPAAAAAAAPVAGVDLSGLSGFNANASAIYANLSDAITGQSNQIAGIQQQLAAAAAAPPPPPTSTVAAFDPTQALVASEYAVYLHRAPDPGGAAYWAGRFNSDPQSAQTSFAYAASHGAK